MELFWDVIIGLGIAALFKDLIVDPYFCRISLDDHEQRDKRIEDTKKMNRMTRKRANSLLRLRGKVN